MLTLCPDTNLFVRIVDEERGWEECQKCIADANETIVLQSVIFEVRKVCSERYMEAVESMEDEAKRERLLEKYETNSLLHRLLTEGEDVSALDVVDDLIDDLPQRILALVLRRKMKIFPDPLNSDFIVLENPQEAKSRLEELIGEQILTASDEWLKRKLEDYFQKYDLKKCVTDVENTLSQDPLYFNVKFDMHYLATYLKAKEIWSSLELRTSDTPLYAACKKHPDKFSISYCGSSTRKTCLAKSQVQDGKRKTF